MNADAVTTASNDDLGHHDHHDDETHGGHSHQHAAHSHGNHHGHNHPKVTDEKRIAWAFFIILSFMVIEVGGGLFSGSLALLADAGHMVSDAAALGMSWTAIMIGKRPPDANQSYGYRRLEVLVAFVNGCALFVVSGWIIFEAVQRFKAPVHVLGGPMLYVALAGLLANIIAFFVLNGGNRANLNVRSAWLHVLGDLVGFIVTIIAAGIILKTGWSPIDPVLSVLVALMILRGAYGVVKESAHILLERTPSHLSADVLRRDILATVPGVTDVHHVHIWSLTAEQAVVTLHAHCGAESDTAQIMMAMNRRLREKFGVTHATIQIDPTGSCDARHC
jgi:cobalt-zinc-cadmium efflux system protein